GRNFFDILDFIAPVVPIGLAAGRLGNFINGELWGKVAHVPWAMKLQCWEPRFGNDKMYCPQGLGHYLSAPHQPSQLYELLLEGVLLFIICYWYSAKPRPRMAVGGLFILGYGVFRFAIEFVR